MIGINQARRDVQKWHVLVQEKVNSLHAQHFPLIIDIEHFRGNPLLIYAITGKKLTESVSINPTCSSGHLNPTGEVRAAVLEIMFLWITISIRGIVRHGNLLRNHVGNEVGHGQRCGQIARLIYPKVERVFCNPTSPGEIAN